MSVDGTVMVLLPPEQYANLAAARRQTGAQAAQIQAFKLALERADALLAEAALLLGAEQQPPAAAPAEARRDLLARIAAERRRTPRGRSRRTVGTSRADDRAPDSDRPSASPWREHERNA
jgi:hypothetical protein